MQKAYLKPLDQLFLLNREIYSELDKFTGTVLVVGGQAVAYWLDYYSEEIEINSSSEFAAQSVDIDYAMSITDIQAMADCWDVNVSFAENHQPPSIALMQLEDCNKKIKADSDGLLFLDVDEYLKEGNIKSNIVDVIDRPAGFSEKLLSSDKEINLYSTLFLFPVSFNLEPHDNLRILSPLGCLKSRMANLFQTPKNQKIEVTRIKLLVNPLIFYMQDYAEEYGFKEYKSHLDELKKLILSDDGVKLYTIYDVNLIKVYQYIASTTPDTPEPFIEKELVYVLNKMNTLYERRKKARANYLSNKKI